MNNTQLVITTLGVAALAVGCCSKGTGGSYAAAPYSSASGGTAETQETTTSTQTTTAQATTSGNQTIPLYKEQVAVGTRQVDDGTVHIKKFVKTETVNQPVTLRQESLVIDREPAATGQEQASAGSQAFQNQEIAIQLHREEPVVQTTVVPNGQIVAQTRTDTQQKNIQAQVRSEDVAVDKGNAQNVIVSDNVTKDQGQAMGGGGEVGGQATGSAGTITDITMLSATADPTSLQGRQVQLSNAKIDRITENILVIKDSNGKDAYIQMDQMDTTLQPGDTVNVTGTVNSAANTPQASGQQVLVHAQSVQKAK